MITEYRTAFDLIAHPERIQPPYGLYAIFLLAGAALVLLACVALRFRWRRRVHLALFAVVWVSFVVPMVLYDTNNVTEIRRTVERGGFSTVEGCLAYFRPGYSYGTKSTAGNEEWSVAGETFSYGAGEVRPVYRRVEANGGAVHLDSRVRVFFVKNDSYQRNEIVRIDVIDHACPKARYVEPGQNPEADAR